MTTRQQLYDLEGVQTKNEKKKKKEGGDWSFEASK
jgi:hypothetical protein